MIKERRCLVSPACVAKRHAYLLALIIHCTSLGVAQPAAAQPHPRPSQLRLGEAAQLEKVAEGLSKNGKYQEALPLAEKCLEIRESELGTGHPDVAASLNNLAELHDAQGAYGRAAPLYKRALAINEKTLGASHPDVAKSLNNLALLYKEQGAYKQAEPLLIRALTINEKALGVAHPDVALSLNNLALLYQAQGEYGRTEPLLVRALGINEKALGGAHPIVAVSLNNLAGLYQVQGAYRRAEPLYERALAIRKQVLGGEHPAVATSLNNLALLYQSQGGYRQAELLLVQALAINEKALGLTHPSVAASLNNLAMIYEAQGAYGQAERLYERALAIHERVFGSIHPAVAASLNNLAMLYEARGAYGQAERLYERALTIHEQVFGAIHPAVAASLNNLAGLYQEQGAYGLAEPFFARALAIHEQALGAIHPYVATSLDNLAGLYHAQGRYGSAEPLMKRALSIRERALGTTHPDIATSLNNLAMLYHAQGAHGSAAPLLARALAIQEQSLGATHPAVATSLDNLAGLYRAQAAYGHAEPLMVRALAIREKTLGLTHPYVAVSLDNLAMLYEVRGAYERAMPHWSRASEVWEENLRLELGRLSESRKRDAVSLLRKETDIIVSFSAHSVPMNASALNLAMTTILRRKGRILESLFDRQAALRTHLTVPLRDKLSELADVRGRLANQLRKPPTIAASAKDTQAAMRSRIDDLERELIATSAEYRVQAEPVTVAKVQAALPRGAALVEFVRYNRFDPHRARSWQEARYLAYILPWQGAPQWVPLGDSAQIETRIDAVLATMGKGASVESARATLRSLDALVFAPVRDRLTGQGVSHLILSPDGKLNLVPFEALIDPQGRYGLEQWLVSYVTSGRDLLRLAVRSAPQSPAMIVADPDYGPGQAFARLAGTRAEAQEVADYLGNPQTLTGDHATKAALAKLAGPAVLHIATHGFATLGAARSATPPTNSQRGMFLEISALPLLPQTEDPADALDRAGLALAGANIGSAGILSARELAGLDLWGTQLVVLSACESGTGTVQSGEGVYGLRRALVLAGAQSQVVSLWSVSDTGTRALMREFYGALARGTGRAEALRRAKLVLLRQPQYAHPYYWAAFIAAGDWTPLDKAVMSRGTAKSP